MPFRTVLSDEIKNIAGLPRLSYSLGLSGAVPAFDCARSSHAMRGIAAPEMANISTMLFSLFIPADLIRSRIAVGRLMFVMPAFSVFAADSAPLYKYGFTLENQVELLLE